jgi:hypothetical protein
MSFPHGAFAATHAARKRRLREQGDRIGEEEMTNYSVEDLENNWEFKIVRSERGAFRKPEVFQRLLQEEAMAGWEMVEKLDDRRVRFKRRKDARRKDATLPQGVDPYRSQFDAGASRTLVLVLIGLLTMVALGAGVLFFGLQGGRAESTDGSIFWLVVGNAGVVALIFMLMLAAIIARRR